MRDKEFIDLNRAYLQICEQQKVGVPVGNKSDAEALKGLIPKGEKVHEVPRKTTLQKANYEPEGELVADETDLFYESAAGGIVGGAPKPSVAKPAVRGIKKPVPAPAKVSENQEFEMWVNSLVEDGYDLSDYTWDDMYEMYVNAGENESDLFDYILEYLVAEGYADTNENALVIMANMSEEWRESIVEAVSGGSYYDLPGVVIRAASGAASKLLNRGQPPAAKPKPHPSDSKLVDVSTADKAAKNLPGSRVYNQRQQQQSR